MDKLTAIKIKYDDGTYSDEIPISALSENVEWDSTHTLVDILGNINVDVTGTIQDQISQLSNEKVSATQLQNYVASQLNEDVSTWLNNNVNPVGSTVIVDSSLTIGGAAADAKKTGDEINELKSTLNTTLAWHYAEIGTFDGTSFSNYTARARVYLNSLPKYKTIGFHYPSTLTYNSLYINVDGTWSAIALAKITNNRYTFAENVDQMIVTFRNKNDETADITQVELEQTYVFPIDTEIETAIDTINEEFAVIHGDVDNLSESIDDLSNAFNTTQAVSTLNGGIVQIHLPGIKNQIRRLVLN